jgi:excisionase family DNA binding protein
MTQDKVTIQEAVKTLGISRKTLYRWIDKGLLSREKEGNRAYVSLAEVRALCDRVTTQQDIEIVSGDSQETHQTGHDDTNRVTVDMPYLEGLLVRLGQLEAEKRYLLEYKGGLEAKERELADTKASLNTQAHELSAVRSELDNNSHELDQARETISKARNELQRLLQVQQESEQKARALMDREVQIERKNKELEALMAENERLRVPWWKKLLKKS